MNNQRTLWRSRICWWFPLLLFNMCTPDVRKTTHKVYTVEIKQMKFQPAELTVLRGDTVVWVNRDIVTHDVTEETNRLWTSGPLTPGKSWSMVVLKSADYFCSIHVIMKGRLVVKKP